MSLPDELLNIDTPENVAFGYSVAGIGSRFLAALVDTTLIVIIQAAVLGTAALFLRYADLYDTVSTWMMALFSLLAFLLFWGYYIFFEMLWNGQSPGKRWVGLRVIRMSGTPITLTESIIRNLVRLIDFLPMAYGIGVITMFFNDQARRLGDLAAGSLVVHDQGQMSIQSIAVQQNIAMPYVLPELDPTLPLERLQQADIDLLEEFLARRTQLANSTTLGRQILRRLNERMNVEASSEIADAEKYLAAILKAIRDRRSSNETGEQ